MPTVDFRIWKDAQETIRAFALQGTAKQAQETARMLRVVAPHLDTIRQSQEMVSSFSSLALQGIVEEAQEMVSSFSSLAAPMISKQLQEMVSSLIC